MKRVAIITVNFNGLKDTLEFLESLKKLDNKNLETKVVVVDNGSEDDSVKIIHQKFPKVDIVQTGSNTGFTGGYNRGLEYGKAWGADYFLIINNDTLINSPNLLTELVKVIESDSKIGLAIPKIYFAPGFEFFKDRYSKEDLGKVIWYAGGTFDWDNINSKHRGIDEVDQGQFDQVEKVDYTTACCYLIKKEVLDIVGFYDEKLFTYFEDTDYSQRLNQHGLQKYYVGGVSIYHKVSQTAGIGSPFSDYFGTRNRLIFGFRYARLRTKFALLRQALKMLITGRSMEKKGIIDFLKGKTGADPKLVRSNSDPVYPYSLSIVFSNYNTADLCQKLLASIFTNKSGFDSKTMEVIMVDDCSPIDPENQIKDYLTKITFVRNLENKGFTRSYNRVMRLAKGKYVLVLNSDMEVLPGSISEILKEAEQAHGQAVLGGRLYNPDMSSQDSVYHFPTILGVIKEYFFNIQGAYFMYVPKPEIKTKVQGIVGACMLIPQKIINRVGYLDENIVSYFEDHEYCRRLFRENIPVYFTPAAKFIHLHGASFSKLGTKTLEIHRQSSIYYYGKFYFILLYITLLLAQKLTGKKPPGSMEASAEKTNILQKFNNLLKNLNLK